jgi:hypothetical protein
MKWSFSTGVGPRSGRGVIAVLRVRDRRGAAVTPLGNSIGALRG